MTRLPLSSLLALSLAACAGADPQEAAPAYRTLNRPIYNGTADTSDAHRAVVALRYKGDWSCSGTLIADRVVLTAAHCLQSRRALDFEVGFGNNANHASMTWVKVSQVQRHPQYNATATVNDIGLVRMAAPAPSGVVPIPALPKANALTSTHVGEVVEFSGFGVTETGASGAKLKVSGALVMICESAAGCRWQGNEASPWTICYNQSPGGPCSGDSGGPAFVTRDGAEYVAGITSYGDMACRYWGCSAKVDHYWSFLDAFLNPASDGVPCAFPGACASGFCVDGVCCDAACTAGTCDACSQAAGASRDGTCEALKVACDDGSRCTVDDFCVDGKCLGSVVACPPPGQCQQAPLCSDATGQCVFAIKPQGTGCDDGDKCTEADGCDQGTCRGAAKVCPEPDACHLPGSCDSASGDCVFQPKPDGTVCGDGKECEAGACAESCGCSTAGSAAPPALALMAALGALRRRTRRRAG